MISPWVQLQASRRRFRWPLKWLVLAVTLFGVLYPHPGLFVRHLRHLRELQSLSDPGEPALRPLLNRFEASLAQRGITSTDPQVLLAEVNQFVRREIPYGWDWDVWGVADYLPTLREVIARGREDCDGRAVLAAAILRASGVPAELVADTRHMWVRTPMGETMDPLGPPIIQTRAGRFQVRWAGLADLGPPAFGIAVFPAGRELIIVGVAWLLLLPRRPRPARSLIALMLLVQGLFIIRAAGRDPVHPATIGIVLGLASVLAGVAALSLRRSNRRHNRPRLGGLWSAKTAEEPS